MEQSDSVILVHLYFSSELSYWKIVTLLSLSVNGHIFCLEQVKGFSHLEVYLDQLPVINVTCPLCDKHIFLVSEVDQVLLLHGGQGGEHRGYVIRQLQMVVPILVVVRSRRHQTTRARNLKKYPTDFIFGGF